MANCINIKHPSVKPLAEKFDLSLEDTGAVIAVWQEKNDKIGKFPNTSEFEQELILTKETNNVESTDIQQQGFIKNDLDRKINELGDVEAESLSQKLNESDINNNKLYTEVSKKLQTLLERVGIEYKNVDKITDSNNEPINAVAKADILAKTIEVIESKRDFSTLPEETSHVYFELLGEDNLLYQSMMDKITRFKIYESTREEYQEVPGYTDEKIKKEAIGKLISIQVLNQQNIEDTELNQDLFNKWWKKAWNWIKSRLGGLKSNETSSFVEAAKNILEGKVDGLLSLDQVIDLNQDSTGMSYYQIDVNDEIKRNELIKSLENKEITIDFDTGKMKTKDGRLVKTDVETWSLAKNNKYLSDYNKKIQLKASYFGAANSAIMNELSKGVSKDELLKEGKKDEILGPVINKLIDSTVEFSKVFVESDRKFFFLGDSQYEELINGMSDIYTQIRKNHNRISRLSNQDIGTEPKIFTDLSIYSPKEDMAGAVDMLVVYPNGSVGIYQYKGVSFREDFKTGQVEEGEGIGRLTEELFNSEVTQLKKILEDEYGIKNFAETRIVPMHVKLNRKYKGEGIDEKAGIAKVEIGYNGERDYLKQIPVANELTEDAALNESLRNLFALRDKLKHKLKNKPKDLKTREKLRTIDANIKAIQLDRDVLFTYTEVAQIKNKLMNRESAPEGSPDELTVSELNDYLELHDAYSTFYRDTKNIAKDLDKDKQSKLREIPGFLDDIYNISMNKLVELINRGKDYDITATVVETGMLGSFFRQLHDYDQPTFRRMAELVRRNSEETRQNINNLIGVMTEKHNNLDKWAKDNNKSLFDAFRMIYNQDTGKLFSQYKPELYQDRSKARKNKDLTWIKKYNDFDVKAFEQNKQAYFDMLDKMYVDKDRISLREKLKKQYVKKFDVRENEKAYFNPKNYYLQLKDAPEYYSDIQNDMNKPENLALKEYYDTYVTYNKELNKILSKRVEKGFVAEIRQDTIDRLAHIGVSAFKDLGTNLLHSLEVREYDISQRELDSKTKKPRPVIPLYFMDKVRDGLRPNEEKTIKEELIKEGYTEDTTSYTLEYDKRILNAEFAKGRKFKSYDLTRSMILFAESAHTNKFANETEETIRGLQNIMKSDRIETKITGTFGKKIKDKFTNETLKTRGMSERDIDSFEKFVNMYWYGLQVQSKDAEFNLFGKQVSANKIAQLVMKYTSTKALALKPILAAGNQIGLLSNAYIAAAEGRVYTQTQMNNAYKLLRTKNKEAKMAVGYFETSARNLTYEKANNLSASAFSKTITNDNAFIMHKHADDRMDAVILVSMLQNYGISEDGKIKRLSLLPEGTKSLYKLSEIKDDKFHLPGVTDNKENFTFFRQYVQKQATKIKGAIPDENKNLIGTTMVGSLLMQFRNWIPGLAETRFKGIAFDPEMQELDVGRFRVFVDEFVKTSSFKDLLKNTGRLIGETLLSSPVISRFKGDYSLFDNQNQNQYAAEFFYNKFKTENPDVDVSFEEYQELRASKLRGIAKELSMALAFFALASLLKALIPDDDEEIISEYLAHNSYLATNRGLLELTFWLNPESISEVIKSPLPSYRAVTDIFKWAKNTADVSTDLLLPEGDPKKAILSKAQKDRTPAFWRTAGLFPFGNQIRDFIDFFSD